MSKISKDMNIAKLIKEYPETAQVLRDHGLGCVGCAIAGMESVEQAAMSHGIEVDKLLKDLNEKVEEKS